MNESLKNHVQQITDLPTIPVVAQEVLGLANDEEISAAKIESIIQSDPAIAAKVLSVANSSFFGLANPVDTLRDAIVRIGFDNVMNIAIGISIMTVLEGKSRAGLLDYQKIFNHSVTVGFVARLISKDLKLNLEQIMINGLLHDIGFLVMNRGFPESYNRVLDIFKSGSTLLEAEKKVFAFCHSDIGAWLAEKWNLPVSVRDSALYHHSPSLAKKHLKHASVIHVADHITTRNICAITNSDPEYPLDLSVMEILGIKETDMKEIEENVLSVSGLKNSSS